MSEAEAATLQVWISAAGLVFVVLTVFYARKAWKEAEATNKQTRDQFAAERRAWCSVEMPGPRVDIASDLVDGVAQIVVTNVGASPAQRVEYFALSWTSEPDEDGLRAAIDRARTEPPEIGMTLFPGQSRAYTASWRYEGTALTAGIKRTFLQGWISYWIAGDRHRHFTPFIIEYRCELTRPHTLGGSSSIPVRLSLPAD